MSTLAQMVTQVRDLITEPVAAFYTDAILKTFINNGYLSVYTRVANMRRGFFEKKTTISYVANQELYALPNDGLVKIILVERVDAQVPQPTNLRPIDITEKNDYSLPSGQDIPIPGTEKYFVAGNNVGIAPIPATAITNVLNLWYVNEPTPLTADGDEPAQDLTTLHHELIVWEAVVRAQFRDRQGLAAALEMRNSLRDSLFVDTQAKIYQEPPRIVDTDPFQN